MLRPNRLLLGVLLAAVSTLLLASCKQADRLRARCLSGDINRCSQLGDMFATGTGGVARDMTRAAEMYERACAGGASDVCNTLGEVYEKSGTFEGGEGRAAQMYEKACTGGSSAGCLNLGLAFAAREDHAKAVALYERSCTGGWAPGCHQLGVSCQQGEGVAKDVPKALTYFAQACDAEYVQGCTTAAEIYAAGQDVARDVASATALYGKAIKVLDQGCEAGTERDCTERDRLRTRITMLGAAAPAPETGAPVPRQPVSRLR